MIKKKILEIIIKHIQNKKINEKTKLKNIKKWDSLMHLNIIFAIEKFFKIKFTISEMSSFKNIEEIIKSVKNKKK
tara:strand:+ start:129 stop:353 length:225 start_codon:yes stop_codon:yes gene_type:complete